MGERRSDPIGKGRPLNGVPFGKRFLLKGENHRK